jgi:hypothetical protein
MWAGGSSIKKEFNEGGVLGRGIRYDKGDPGWGKQDPVLRDSTSCEGPRDSE